LLVEITQIELFNLKQNWNTLYTVGVLNPEIFTLKRCASWKRRWACNQRNVLVIQQMYFID